ncbi:CatB-related O-acetyltransferase [Paenibacillus sp. OAS669]|uniref:CatB-related O-acetyltransferase n=1 Tax=Paenibacillus sp. OAS669 TaxID=2663821 RepID=UPI001789ECD0|nr:CatB-related O-acetyltransferase [Paenibacillus sp. OAS669]MBE1443612.1 acetyltransferase-like isoleucine patch superfamily enzyme [Paenibacillus sp. OAS669]
MSIHSLQQTFPRRVEGSKIFIGEFTYGYPEVLSWGENSILTIGKFCSIADRVSIFLGGEHRPDWVTTYPFNALIPSFSYIQGHPKTKGNVVIGNDVWLGSGATIMSGVQIGDGAVIGARAVVTKYVPPYAVVAGNPGKIIKYRFDDETIRRLLQVQWWNWPLDRIERAIPFLLSTDIQLFLAYCEAQIL